MSMFGGMEISGSALTAQRLRMNVTAENIANAETTKGADGNPYRRKEVTLQSVGQAGDSNLLAFPVLRFSLPDGRTVETQSSWGTNPPAAKPGAQVTVLYDPADPTSASLPAGGSAAVVSGVIIALGCLLIGVGLAAAAFLVVVL